MDAQRESNSCRMFLTTQVETKKKIGKNCPITKKKIIIIINNKASDFKNNFTLK